VPTTYYVMLHSPGPRWAEGVSFREQPGVEIHIAFVRGLLEWGMLALGGPFLDDSGGMAIVRGTSLDEVRALAESDESVRTGLLRVEVKPWLAVMDSISPQP